jgi:hypothetical protein
MRRVLIGLAGGFLLAGIAPAAELTRGVTDVTTIADGAGSSRMLFRLGSAIEVEKAIIVR